MVTVSAPAKVHLIGEHAVVHGYPAIIAAVGLRLRITAEKYDRVIYKDVGWNREMAWTLEEIRAAEQKAWKLWRACAEKNDFSELFTWIRGNEYINYWQSVIGTVLRSLGVRGGIRFSLESEMPMGAGIGSSSAAAVALAKAVAEAYGIEADNEKISSIAYDCEKLIHGTPSGGDNSASCYGRLIWFEKAQPQNVIKPLGDEIPHKLENFVLVYTVKPAKNTGELIQMVRNIPESVREPKMKEIASMCSEMKDVLKRKDYKRMKQIINRTNEILSSFGLSVPECDKIAQAVRNIGGAAKMCGACYGGIMLCWHEDVERLKKTISDLGFEPLEAELCAEGVRVD